MPITDLWRVFFEQYNFLENTNKKILIIQWELKNIDNDITYLMKRFNKVFTISDFIKDGLIKYRSDIQTIPLPFEKNAKLPNFEFDSQLNFYYIFDIDSFSSRKNPLAVIKAFRQAFTENEKVRLFLKAKNIKSTSLYLEYGFDQRIEFIDIYQSQADYLNFIKKMHVLLSFHRSEGFGRVIGEAVINHKFIICSPYGGNLDYLNLNNSIFVDGKLISVKKEDYFFSKDNEWFDVDIDDAANKIKYLYSMIIENQYQFNFEKNEKIFLDKYSISSVGKFLKENL
jgi:hypothetical protein